MKPRMDFDTPAGRLPVVAAAASRAGQWLVDAWIKGAGDAELAIDALALARVCALLDPDSTQVLDRLIGTLGRGRAPAWGTGNLLPNLLAAGASLADAGGLAPGALEYVQQLNELQYEARGANAVLLRIALHGAENVPIAGAAPGETTFDIKLLSNGHREDVARLLSEIETATLFGLVTRQVEMPLTVLLEGTAMANLRAYDLPRAMRLLRARLYTQPGPSLGLATGFDFIRLSQCDDGTFGDFEAALTRMAARGDHDEGLRLKLPVTLQALWTMAEIENPSFRLVGAAFKGTDALLLRGGSYVADERSDRCVQA
jgi:hypothetical protein